MTRSNKTSQSKRTEYFYFTADGEKIVISPNEEGVTSAHIELLHSLDDSEFDAQRRHSYQVRVHLEDYSDDEQGEDINPFLADERFNPEIRALEHEDEVEYQEFLARLGGAMELLLPQQKELLKKVYQDGWTSSQIAREEGVTEAAIRNRLKKIHEKIKKYLL